MKKKMLTAGLLLAMLVLFSAAAYAACPTEESHRYGTWRYKTTPTCTRQGHAFRYCQKCDHWEQRWTAKLPHTVGHWTVTVAPTCTSEGKKEGVCLICGATSRRSVNKLPHTLGEMTVTKEPGCTFSGKGEYTCLICLRCGKGQSQRIDKLEHIYGEWEITAEPEGKKKGTKSSVCELCGDAKTQRFYWEGTLYQDMEPCEEVIRLQEMLRDLGYYSGNIRSGTFGSLTGKAVSRFQREHGMKATEIADPETITAIEAAWEKKTGKSADAE